MKASFDGMRRNATREMNKLFDSLNDDGVEDDVSDLSHLNISRFEDEEGERDV